MATLFPPAKLNLFLKIVGKRPDGYHELESLFAFLDLTDELEVEKSDKFELSISGEFASLVDQDHNLLTKILDHFVKNFSISPKLRIRLVKNIPVAAGLGGGSADAAYFMKALNEIFFLNLSKSSLQKISLNFGSDIAFFFEDQASIIRGRGELIENYPHLFSLTGLLVNPRISLSTAEIFKKFSENFSSKISTQDLLKMSISELIENFPNDLASPAISTLPTIKEILDELRNCGAEFAKMSGSGASCFGIFDQTHLEKAEEKILKKFPNFFVKKVKISSDAA